MPRHYTPLKPEYPVNPWVLGIAAFCVAMFVLNYFFGVPPACLDGSYSTSIGTQGACSHHGGVVSRNGWIFWVSAAIGAVAVFIMDASAKTAAKAKETLRFREIDNLPVPEGYDAKEYTDLRAVGFSDAETREIIARRKPASTQERKEA